MPVVKLDLRRLTKMVGADRRRIVERLPYVGLDIESASGDSLRVEYSPNRPDLGTDFGIARALRGLLGLEVGLPSYAIRSSGVSVKVDPRLRRVRPYISCATAIGLRLDDEGIRQIIALQEDLHNGLGRRRRLAAIGLHDMDAISKEIRYEAVPSSFKFLPLGSRKRLTVAHVLSSTPEGKAYGGFLGKTKRYPMLLDSNGVVLSFPPVINGNSTRVSARTRNIFVDVTGTDEKVVGEILAILATTLAEAGGKVGSVKVEHPGRAETTPHLRPLRLPLKLDLIEQVLGLGLTRSEAIESLRRSRLDVEGKFALAPRYRIDMLHPVDVAEEVAVGYGIDRIGPIYPPSDHAGNFNRTEQFLDAAATIMAGAGMTEMMTYELTDPTQLYKNFGRPSDDRVEVEGPRSLEHSVLRDSLLPTLAAALSGNAKADYPQRVFEIGRVYTRTGGGVGESWYMACLIAHSQASFSEAKMYLQAACRTLAGVEVTSAQAEHWAFASGRCAEVSSKGRRLGAVGELRPETLEAFRIGVPVSGFELDLSTLHKQLK